MNEYINRQAQIAELSLLLAQLNKQLISDQIVDDYGKTFAIIKNFYYDNQKRINLLISLIEEPNDSELKKINLDLIQKANLFEKAIIVI